MLKKAISSVSGEPTLSSSLAGQNSAQGGTQLGNRNHSYLALTQRGGARNQWLKEVSREKIKVMSGWRAEGGRTLGAPCDTLPSPS